MSLVQFPSHSTTFSTLFTVGVLGLIPFRCAQATPVGDPLPGPSGLGVIPTTQTVAPNQFAASLGSEYVDVSGADGHARLLPFANLSYGFNNGEVGASYLNQKTDIEGFSSSNSYFTLHGKYRLYNSPDGKTAFAVGAHYYDFGSDSGTDLGDTLSLYATGSYEFRKNNERSIARFHLGVLGQRVHVSGDSTTFARPFVGVEALLSPDVSIAADYLTKHSDVAQGYTLSVRYQPQNKPLSAQIGVGKLRSDTKFFVGLTYTFGHK
ncbi:hypothetical protein IAD21_05729 [Abditibacteriota bacterium]|nr:hypothetical protein IAD21_05729 [Abditibacteriota bacterium]